MGQLGFGCRDCRTCTMTGGAKAGMVSGLALLYIYTCGIAWIVKKVSMRRCPNCRHVLSRHLNQVPTVAVQR